MTPGAAPPRTAAEARTSAVRAAFRAEFGREADAVWAAPGRVNLIGEHTDYNEGHALPFAIEERAYVAVRLRADPTVRCRSQQHGQTVQHPAAELNRATGWAAYPLGTIWALQQEGLAVQGFDLLLDSDVPEGAGLSSSAAVEVATALGVTGLCAGWEARRWDRRVLALAACRGENDVVRAPVGPLDQLASLLSEAGSALLLDCRSLQTEVLPMPLDSQDLALLVIDTGSRHDHATGGYADRRRECAEAARALGVPALRDATSETVEAARLPGVLARRARHVVHEEDRVARAADVLRAGDLARLGPLLTASHRSLRDDFEVSTPLLDAVAEAALGAGALGARLTGGGFGGCVLALVPVARIDAVRSAVRPLAAALSVRAVQPAAGADRVG